MSEATEDRFVWDATQVTVRKPKKASKVFCPTGPGGGVDSSCSPGHGGGEQGEKPKEGWRERYAREAMPKAEIEQRYPKANPEGKDTQKQFLLGENSDGSPQYTPERQAIHARARADALANAKPQKEGEREFLFLGGGTASGKSTAVNTGQVKLPPDAVKVDVDEVKMNYLPEMKRALVDGAGDQAAKFVHEESSDVGKMITNDARAMGANVVMDGVGDNRYEKLAGKVKQARDAGYRVTAKYMTCSIEKAKEKAAHREKTQGRVVEDETLVSLHAGVSRVLPRAIDEKLFDDVELWDTELRDEPRLVLTQKEGVTKIHDKELWRLFLDKAKLLSEIKAMSEEELDYDDLRKLYLESLGGKPSGLIGPKADAWRKRIKEAGDRVKRDGTFLDIPVDWVDDRPLFGW